MTNSRRTSRGPAVEKHCFTLSKLNIIAFWYLTYLVIHTLSLKCLRIIPYQLYVQAQTRFP
jgi:hypothetical protein